MRKMSFFTQNRKLVVTPGPDAQEFSFDIKGFLKGKFMVSMKPQIKMNEDARPTEDDRKKFQEAAKDFGEEGLLLAYTGEDPSHITFIQIFKFNVYVRIQGGSTVPFPRKLEGLDIDSKKKGIADGIWYLDARDTGGNTSPGYVQSGGVGYVGGDVYAWMLDLPNLAKIAATNLDAKKEAAQHCIDKNLKWGGLVAVATFSTYVVYKDRPFYRFKWDTRAEFKVDAKGVAENKGLPPTTARLLEVDQLWPELNSIYSISKFNARDLKQHYADLESEFNTAGRLLKESPFTDKGAELWNPKYELPKAPKN
jgi:hypothetical protein